MMSRVLARVLALTALMGAAVTPSYPTLAQAAPAAVAPATGGSINDRMNGDIFPVHDPAIIKQGETYYLFTTSQAGEAPGLIHIRTSKDLVTWTRAGAVFPDIPEWARKAVAGTKGVWAPDISFVDGKYLLYYAVSTFGSNHSVIGLATSPTLDPKAPGYGWTDQGLVIESPRGGDYNAIDPNHVVDADGHHWLALGSFWTGLKLIRLDPATGKPAAGEKLLSIARRPNPGAVEGAFIIHRNEYYYLFASYDFCCRGAASTYYTVVGRSKDVAGPYVDYDGKPMMKGYGQIVLHGDLDKTKRWRGPGHVAILRDPGRDYIVYHSYDARNGGRPTLRVAPLGWTADGWPVAQP